MVWNVACCHAPPSTRYFTNTHAASQLSLASTHDGRSGQGHDSYQPLSNDTNHDPASAADNRTSETLTYDGINSNGGTYNTPLC